MKVRDHYDSASALQVAFPTALLGTGPKLLNPANLDSTYQYYLLENLAVGLVRDSIEQPSGYAGILATDWTQQDAKTWRFKLREGMKWSDGSAIEPTQIQEHFNVLKGSRSRHLHYLKSLEEVTLPAPTLLELRFSKPVNAGLLHELSLADCVVLKSEPGGFNWQVTSGPYSVQKWDASTRELEIAANPYSQLLNSRSPQRAVLRTVKLSDLAKLWSSEHFDLFLASAFTSHAHYEELKLVAKNQKLSPPNSIYYFSFGRTSSFQRSLSQRAVMANALLQAMKGFPSAGELKRESQMVPEGYSGRLEILPTSGDSKGTATKLPDVVRFELWEEMRESLGFEAVIRKAGQIGGFRVQIGYRTFASKESNADVLLNVFKGNQKDALGSWSFLTSQDPPGFLAGAYIRVAELLNSVVSAPGQRRDELLQEVHRRILAEIWAVPVLAEPSIAFASDRISLDRWNPFDLRMRINEIDMRQ